MMHRLLCCTLLLPASLFAHTDSTSETGTAVSAGLSATWRDEGAVLNDAGIWQLPGVLMGGEAYPVEEGVSLDDANLSLRHQRADGVHGFLQIASHDNGSDAELHHAFAGIRTRDLPIALNLEAGRMAALFSPGNGEHASSRLFSEAPLALDAFFGRQYNDEGARLLLGDKDGFSAGVEGWRGSAFPATAGDGGGAQDLFLQHRGAAADLRWQAGVWIMQADALARTDARYSASGHSHSSAITTAPEVWFDGRTDAGGVFLRGHWQVTPASALWLEGEWMRVEPDGILRDATRESGMEGNYNGGWAQLAWEWQRHTLGVRHEQLALDNTLTGAAAAPLAELAGVYNAGDDPTRTSLVWRWQLADAFALRVEAVSDASQPEQTERVGVGLIWQEALWSTE